MSSPSGLRQLLQLASLYGVQTAYYSVDHRRRTATAESLVAVLRGLGASIAAPGDAPAALRERKQELQRRTLEPVTVAWDGFLGHLPVNLPRDMADCRWQCRLTLESGETETWECSAGDLLPWSSATAEGVEYLVKGLSLQKRLPLGYHRLSLEIPGRPLAETLLVAAPTRAHAPFDGGGGDSTWGVFLPLYSLRRRQSASPCGDFSDLEALADWTGSLGGGIVATLPLLAAFLDEPFDPSPYNPVSRLLWNEFYLDVTRAPELERCQQARSLLSSEAFRQELEGLRQSPAVDYRKGMRLKRRVLEELAKCCVEQETGRSADFKNFLARHPVVEDYARFRATTEKRGASWKSWPERLQKGRLIPGDYDEEPKQYHAYVQWLAHEQVRELSRKGQGRGASLYLDLPLGVHHDGYDAWRRQDLFATKFDVGASPDAFFTRGQNWGFPPIYPEELRRSGYDYFRDYLRHHFEAARLLRIDHVMGLHRLFWIPQGMEPGQGLYVRYPAEEFYAILALESHRSKAAIVGEDLGTVPPAVRPAMRRHGLYGMYVAYFEMSDNPRRALRSVPSNVLASVNTHDMPPFSAFWQGLDIRYRQELGHQSEEGAKQESEEREKIKEALLHFLRSQGLLGPGSDDQQAVLDAIHTWLGKSRAPMVLVNLEDLWLETRPQNVPGTGPEQPNWHRRARHTFEEFSQMPRVVEVLGGLNSLRKLAPQRR